MLCMLLVFLVSYSLIRLLVLFKCLTLVLLILLKVSHWYNIVLYWYLVSHISQLTRKCCWAHLVTLITVFPIKYSCKIPSSNPEESSFTNLQEDLHAGEGEGWWRRGATWDCPADSHWARHLPHWPECHQDHHPQSQMCHCQVDVGGGGGMAPDWCGGRGQQCSANV